MSELNGHAATLPPVGFKRGPLLSHHREALHARGLTDATIEAAGLYSEEKPDALGALLNWPNYPKRLPPALIIPYPLDAAGRNGYCRARPDNPRVNRRDGKQVKYESPRGTPNRVYIHGIDDTLADSTAELLITEGEFKALKATQEGFPCIGLTGAFGWKAGKAERLLGELENINWNNRPVFIVFDSDIVRKPDVADGESRLASLLKNRGAHVKVVRLPDGPPNGDGKPTKLGLDDYLAKYGAGEFRKLLDAASDPEPGEQQKRDAAALDPAEAAKGFVETGMKDGVSRLRFYQGAFLRWSIGSYSDVPTAEVRAHLVAHLSETWARLSTGITANVVDHVRSQTLLPFDTVAPAWLDGPREWNAGEVLSTTNAIVHLPTFAAGKENYSITPTPKLFTLSALDYPFDPYAAVPTNWLAFLESIFDGDQESILLLQEWFGLALLPETRFQKILFLLGERRSGKGTILRILRRLVGEQNVANPTLSGLGDRFGLSNLIGRLLAVISDARLSGRSDQAAIVERLLSISGEDAQSVDRKHLPIWTGRLSTRFVIVSNELPRLNDTSGALASRLLVLQTRKSFLGREALDLTDILLAEISGILLWAIRGWQSLKTRGRFVQPSSCADVGDELADLGSPVSVFVRERCRVAAEYSVPRDVLYRSYVDWCKEQGRQHIEDSGGFGRMLRAAVPTLGNSHPRVDGERVRCYLGIRLG